MPPKRTPVKKLKALDNTPVDRSGEVESADESEQQGTLEGSSMELRLAEMMKQIQELQMKVAEQHQQLETTERISTSSGMNEEAESALVTALGALNKTLEQSSSRSSAKSPKLYDLPDFDGRPEDWPMFREAFVATTEEYQYTDRQNMMRLQKAIKGKARETIECLLIHSGNVKRVMQTLEDSFGRPEQLVKSQIEKIRSVSRIPEGRIDLLVPFATKVQNLSSFLEAADCEHHLCNPTLMDELLLKLPTERRMDWAKHAVTIKPRVNIRNFSDWLQEISKMVNIAFVTEQSLPVAQNRRNPSQTRFFHVNQSTEKRNNGSLCKLCSLKHDISSCMRFINMESSQRWRVVRQQRLCFNCLRSDHRSNNCTQEHTCDITGCTKKVHKLLHEPRADQESNNTWQDPNNLQRQVFTSSIVSSPSSKLLFKIIPVKLYAGEKVVTCYAFFDEGSSVSLINEGLVSQLGINGTKQNLTLQWFGSTSVTEPSSCVNMQISGVGPSSKKLSLENVRTVKDLKLPTQTLDISQLHPKFRSRKKLPIYGYEDATPDLLIGLDNAHLGVGRKVAADGWKGPAVVLTKLGWVVYGPNDGFEGSQNQHSFYVNASEIPMDNLDQIINDYIANDSLDVRDAEHIESSEVTRAKFMLETTTKRKGDRYETGLLWKNDQIILPPSRLQAEKIMLTLEKKFQRDENYCREYTRIMKEYEEKGYIRKLTAAEASKKGPKTWYLPHFGVSNPNKPGKLRIVFDAAAETNGTSLNFALLSGPDQYQDLVSVLMRFRQRSVGVCADIVEMFHQVRIMEDDQDAQRFLWRPKQSDEPICEYVMNVMTFGATCSPCSAHYVKNKNALEFQNQYPDAVDAILKNHYVDDLVHCFDNEDDAVKTCEEIVWIHKKGGFDLKRFVSNSKLVNQNFNGNQENPSVLNLERGDTGYFQKVLGMHWDTKQDSFQFVMAFGKVDPVLLEGRRMPTKREALSVTMSVFDPFCLAAEYSLTAKVMLQEIWRQHVGWDEHISGEAGKLWIQWLNNLKEVKNMSIPRCYSSSFFNSPLELHVFSDASEIAYAAVGYWRVSGRSGGWHLAFVMGKTKCAPLKLTTIPRLELQSAVLATRIRQIILRNHDIKPSRIVMWNDSRTVLSWIKSDHRRYKPYVAHRVNEILENSTAVEWRWVPSALNPADFGTRLKDGKRESFWTDGPKFLMGDESTWPDDASCPPTTIELRQKFTVMHIQDKCGNFDEFSNFQRLKRVVGWILRFKRNGIPSKFEKVSGGLKVWELEQAEMSICRSAQIDAFAEEYNSLTNKGRVEKNSTLWKLTPCLNESKVICIDGRINAAGAISSHTRRPMILPKEHHLTNIIVDHYHWIWNHQNTNTIIADIRRRYWIPNIRAVVRHRAKKCPQCKINNAKPKVPLMGQLPKDRLTPFVRPFTYVGLDYMGPFLITIGRSRVKRWIALFTCLTTRAVHLEIANDLSTDTCLMCIRNFTSRRGTPVRIRSDNGTNFIGADRELRKQLRDFDHRKIADVLANRKIEWLFNCPLNPHAGGCWERLVRSVKRAMGHALYNESLQEHSLYSLMCEAENIINSRPLTHIPLDSPSDEPLTPNHFLLGISNSDQTPHPHEEQLIVTRKQWRKVQQIQHRFWKKWVAEYLPDLCRRTKWFSSVKPLSIGDLVLLCDSNIHRSKWPMGRITEVFSGKDQQVRSAEVQTSSGVVRRPVCILAKLDIGESDMV